ncbi:MAG: Jag N-terminal domain-containing protein [Proteobacteria bacterium]|nr:Jag N-terminal domain-containing protein [Pseudomonadota bacterium]MBU1386791.1 Jag N-terminal domain-containing protein [Pseudomonadota bacterium]MBU1544735.1 Jag N-terminal domain-containing protein [Pseudomonadota bacterium]MBU2481904.1 Jag N-terminal domain-containing protein [Pseudomonadota bacterium]
MTQTQEFSGKDVTIAVKNACAALSLSKNQLKYDVISEGTSGIFGIVGRKDAKIKVYLPELPDEAQRSEGIKSFVDEAFGEETRLEEKPKPKPKKTKPAPSDIEKISKEPAPDASETPAPEETTDDTPADDKPVYDKPEPVDVTQESIDLGIESLQKMADLITDDTIVSAHTEEDRLTLKIEGGNAGILIGRKGQTLDAMQFLADKIINRKSEGRVRVKVDIEGYMETRKANLKHLAFKMADKAKKTGRPATINQMSAQDRRIVHLALKDDTAVRTQSMGDGYYRRLVIFPKKKTSFRGKRQSKR